jgi:bifunctional non-homologous end joining protein LigD
MVLARRERRRATWRSLVVPVHHRLAIIRTANFCWCEIRISELPAYLTGMLQVAFEPCIPTRGTQVPAGPDWIHEVKHDGYRLIVRREGKRVRLFTRNGHDWTDRYPLIAEAALRNRSSSFVIDGEAVLLGVDGISDFNGLHSRRHNDEVQLYAFDILALDGEDGEIGPDLFRQACKFGLEGLVSKRRDPPYRAGRSPHWIKVKNRKHAAMARAKDFDW